MDTNEKGGTDHINGMIIRMNQTFNAMGATAPIYLTIHGLTLRELPPESCPSGVLIVPVNGLCISSEQDVRYNDVGYIAFVRNTTNPASKNS